jgi:glutathione S-transferase
VSIVVHHLEDSRSQRILWMLEELGLDYEITYYKRNPKTMLAPPELKQVHPLGKAPAVVHDGKVLVETGAVVEYFAELTGELGPPTPDDAQRWRQFLHYAEGSLMPPLLALLVIGKLGPLGWPARKPLNKMFKVHLDWLESELATRQWFAGDAFSAADVMMSFPMEAAGSRGAGLDAHPNIKGWLARIHARPAYKTALEKGGPYAYA